MNTQLRPARWSNPRAPDRVTAPRIWRSHPNAERQIPGGKLSTSAFASDILAEVPRLRAFGASLSGSASAADDLVQETLLKAWSHRTSFIAGTNLRAWLFTILRNSFLSQRRKLSREIGDDGRFAERLATPARQQGHLDLVMLRRQMCRLPSEQRQALTLIGILGCSYAEAAIVGGVALGTMKSRVNRARCRLALLLDLGDFSDIGPHGRDLAVLTLPIEGRQSVPIL